MRLSFATTMMSCVWFTAYVSWLLRSMIVPPQPIRAEGPRPIAARIEVQRPVTPVSKPVSQQPPAKTPSLPRDMPVPPQHRTDPTSLAAMAPPVEPPPPPMQVPTSLPAPAPPQPSDVPPMTPRFGTQEASAAKMIEILLECPAEMTATKLALAQNQLQVVWLSTVGDRIRSAMLPNARGLLEMQSGNVQVNAFLDRHLTQAYRWFALNPDGLPPGLASLVQHAFESARTERDATWHLYLIAPPQVTARMDEQIVAACQTRRLTLEQVGRATIRLRLLPTALDVQVHDLLPREQPPFGPQLIAPNVSTVYGKLPAPVQPN